MVLPICVSKRTKSTVSFDTCICNSPVDALQGNAGFIAHHKISKDEKGAAKQDIPGGIKELPQGITGDTGASISHCFFSQ
jgi:hypothetical protein